jgi:hypothetical protein
MKPNYLRHSMVAFIGALVGLSPRTAAAQATPAPCSLLTTAQVSAVVGVSVSDGKPIAATGCSWSAPHVMTTLSLWDASEWEKMKAPLVGFTKNTLSGLGDDAFFSTGGSPSKQFATLTVKKGNTAYVFHAYGVDLSQQMSIEKGLAGSVLARL